MGVGVYSLVVTTNVLSSDTSALHEVEKHHTQQLEHKQLTLRTRIKRLARKTICFSKSIQMHDLVIGLFINRFEFGMKV